METSASLSSAFAMLKSRISSAWHGDSPSSSILRNMTALALGAAGGKAISALSTLAITRIYQPEHFGALSVFIAVTALACPLATLTYAAAIPLPRRDGLAANLACACGCLLILIAAMLTLLLWAAGPSLFRFLSMDVLVPYWWLVPLAIGGTGLYELLSSWAVREKSFKALARSMIWQTAAGAVVKIGLGLLGLKPLGLLAGQVCIQAGGVFSLVAAFLRKMARTWRHVSRRRMLFTLRCHAALPGYRLPSQLLLVACAQSPLFYFAWQFGPQSTGQLGLALMMLGLPVTLVIHAAGQAYFGEISRMGRGKSQDIPHISKSLFWKLFWLGVPLFLVLLLFGPWLFTAAFGQAWQEAGIYAGMLSLFMLTQFVSSPFAGALTVFGKQHLFLVINSGKMATIAVVFFASSGLGLSASDTVLVYSLALSMHNLITALVIFRVIRTAQPCSGVAAPT